MPFGLVYGSSSWRSRLRRRSSTGSMPMLPRGDVEQHLAGERLELPRAAVGGAPDGVRVDRLSCVKAARGHAVRAGEQHADGGGGADRPRRRVGAAVLRRSRCGPPGSCRRRRTPCAASPCSWRDWPAASRFSRRSSIHFSGAGTLRRGEHQAHLVALHHDLLAEAAAGVAHDHADAVLGDAEQAEQNARTSCGACVAA